MSACTQKLACHQRWCLGLYSISVDTHETDVFGIFSVLFQQFPCYCCFSNFRVIAVSILSV